VGRRCCTCPRLSVGSGAVASMHQPPQVRPLRLHQLEHHPDRAQRHRQEVTPPSRLRARRVWKTFEKTATKQAVREVTPELRLLMVLAVAGRIPSGVRRSTSQQTRAPEAAGDVNVAVAAASVPRGGSAASRCRRTASAKTQHSERGASLEDRLPTARGRPAKHHEGKNREQPVAGEQEDLEVPPSTPSGPRHCVE